MHFFSFFIHMERQSSKNRCISTTIGDVPRVMLHWNTWSSRKNCLRGSLSRETCTHPIPHLVAHLQQQLHRQIHLHSLLFVSDARFGQQRPRLCAQSVLKGNTTLLLPQVACAGKLRRICSVTEACLFALASVVGNFLQSCPWCTPVAYGGILISSSQSMSRRHSRDFITLFVGRVIQLRCILTDPADAN